MRIAAQVLLAYAIVLVVGCLWRHIPLPRAAPDVAALAAAYLGLTARRDLAPPIAGAVVIGYLADLLNGTPPGVLALSCGLLAIAGHLVHRRLLVRGWMVTLGFSFFTAVASGILVMTLRASGGGLPSGGTGGEIGWLLLGSTFTALVGPLVFRLCRRLDARFARTHRERDAALEGLVP
jgi:hypothetical protein